MKANMQDKFEIWLSGLMPTVYGNITRKEFAYRTNTNIDYLEWAFSAGWTQRYITLTMDDI